MTWRSGGPDHSTQEQGEGYMSNTLLLGFKGKNNLSGLLVKQLGGDSCLLTNSFSGLKKDIDAIGTGYDCAILFGTDKNLAGTVRIEGAAEKEGVRRFPATDPGKAAASFREAGLAVRVSYVPTAWLCNEAYWHLLGKFSGRALLIHIPTVKNTDGFFPSKVQAALRYMKRGCAL